MEGDPSSRVKEEAISLEELLQSIYSAKGEDIYRSHAPKEKDGFTSFHFRETIKNIALYLEEDLDKESLY